jgi:hypothetical protein
MYQQLALNLQEKIESSHNVMIRPYPKEKTDPYDLVQRGGYYLNNGFTATRHQHIYISPGMVQKLPCPHGLLLYSLWL